MGAGKTTVGKQLSEQLELPVVDTDHYIESHEKRKISDIFSENGEGYFRDLETKSLSNLVQNSPMIITTGGGIILRDENRELMKSSGKIVFLYCDLEETNKRLKNDKSRPLYQGNLEANRKLFEQRLPLYKKANIIVETTHKEVESIVKEIIHSLQIKDD